MDHEARKLYVGGLPPSTQQDELKEHFARYGEVMCVRVVRDHETGLGRGFAFVEFADDEGPRAALQEKEKDSHVFGGRTVDVKRARTRPMRYPTDQHFYWHHANQSPLHNQSPVYSQRYNQSSSNNSNGAYGYRGSNPYKVFVGGLRGHVTQEELRNYFEQFGTITDVAVIRESLTQKPRGFGFITFDSKEAMAKVLETTYHDLNGTKVETKMAIPKNHSYNFDRRQHSNYPLGYGGVYPPNIMPYIINNNYMIPFEQYMYSPHALGDYGYMVNGSANPNMAARQGSPVYAGYGTHFGYDYLGTKGFGGYNGSDSKVNQVMTDKQSIQGSLDSESKSIP